MNINIGSGPKRNPHLSENVSGRKTPILIPNPISLAFLLLFGVRKRDVRGGQGSG